MQRSPEPAGMLLEERTTSPAIAVLRWIALVPGALLAALIAQAFVRAGNYLTMPDSTSFLGRLFIETAASSVMGAVFVIASGKIAPTHHRAVIVVSACGMLVFAGLLLFPAIAARNGWAMWGCLAMAFSAAVVAFASPG